MMHSQPHKARMQAKADRRGRWHALRLAQPLPADFIPASINRHTMQPHQHLQARIRATRQAFLHG